MRNQQVTEKYEMELNYTVSSKSERDEKEEFINNALATFGNYVSDEKIGFYLKKKTDEKETS